MKDIVRRDLREISEAFNQLNKAMNRWHEEMWSGLSESHTESCENNLTLQDRQLNALSLCASVIERIANEASEQSIRQLAQETVDQLVADGMTSCGSKIG